MSTNNVISIEQTSTDLPASLVVLQTAQQQDPRKNKIGGQIGLAFCTTPNRTAPMTASGGARNTRLRSLRAS